jgi:hypothetical protein
MLHAFWIQLWTQKRPQLTSLARVRGKSVNGAQRRQAQKAAQQPGLSEVRSHLSQYLLVLPSAAY